MNDAELVIWARGLFADLNDLANLWATYRVRHADDEFPPLQSFCAGVEVCAATLSAAVTRAQRLMPEEWDFDKAAMQERITDA